MIPAEAVEAAANQLRSQLNDFTTSDILMRKRARMVLIAAAPYMLAGAWEEGGRAAVGHYDTGYPITNPYMLNTEGEK